jgi:apolipoprotein D and lipocalin family protein
MALIPRTWSWRARPWPLAIGLALTLVSGAVFAAPEPLPLPLARNVDLSKVYGGWHIIATIPNSFEKGMVAPYDLYAPDPRGGIHEDFYVQRGRFSAPRKHFTVRDFVAPGTGDAHWQVQVFWPLKLPFLLLYVDPQYRYILWGEDSRKLGWIYARDADVPEADYQDLMKRFAALGYDTTRFRKIVQHPAQIGAPGFWSDGIKPGP